VAASRKTQIVIVGGGAGGLGLARKLARKYSRDTHDVVLVDINRTHIWKPLLHEVAAGSLDANLDEVGYGGHAGKWGYRFFLGQLESIDRDKRTITTAPLLDADGEQVVDRHTIPYDYLVLAIGGVSNDFGVPGVRENAMFLDYRQEADKFRQKLLNACFRANVAKQDGDAARQSVRICVVGGGATGVELSAELYHAAASLHKFGLEEFDGQMLRITLLEAGPRILPMLDEELALVAQTELSELGVDVRTSTQVTEISKGAVHVKGGEAIEADLIVWAAGVKASDATRGMSDLELTRGNQFVVRPTLQTTKDDRIFAIGDCCSCTLTGAERPVPPRAQSAHQMAATAARNIDRLQRGEPLKDFVYNDKGSLVSLSRFSAVGSLMGNLVGGRMAIEGRLARLAYASLYRMHILAVHGPLRGLGLIVFGHVGQIMRPKLKLH